MRAGRLPLDSPLPSTCLPQAPPRSIRQDAQPGTEMAATAAAPLLVSARGPLERVDVDSFTCPLAPANPLPMLVFLLLPRAAALLCTSIVVWHFVLYVALFAQFSLSLSLCICLCLGNRYGVSPLPSSRLRLGKHNLIFILMISQLSWLLFALGVCLDIYAKRQRDSSANPCCS